MIIKKTINKQVIFFKIKITKIGNTKCMISNNLMTVDQVKSDINTMVGKRVSMLVNKGRKHIVEFDAEVIAIYPSVFTIEVDIPNPLKTISYAYTEILCGNVKVNPIVAVS